MIRLMYNKCGRTPGTYFDMCHAGLGEYVVPIRSDGTLLGSINAGFFQFDEGRSMVRIRRTCARHTPLDGEEALRLYRSCIRTPEGVAGADILPGLELLADFLGQTYRMLRPTHNTPSQSRRYHNSSEDTILTHAIEYIRLNASGHITMADLSRFCHCSESYLSRIFKRRTGININVYVNKVRIELAKNHLLLSSENIAEIAAGVGFNDPNYFSRVFTNIIGISPTEFRRRFQGHCPAIRRLSPRNPSCPSPAGSLWDTASRLRKKKTRRGTGKPVPRRFLCSAVFVPLGPDLAGQRDDGVVLRLMLLNARPGGFHRLGLQQQGHAAGQFPLNGPGRRGDAVGDVLPVQQVVEAQALLIVGKENVVPDVFLSH